MVLFSKHFKRANNSYEQDENSLEKKHNAKYDSIRVNGAIDRNGWAASFDRISYILKDMLTAKQREEKKQRKTFNMHLCCSQYQVNVWLEVQYSSKFNLKRN